MAPPEQPLSNDVRCPWQLYVFSVLHLLGFLATFVDLCSLMTGSGEQCTSSEQVTSTLFALTFAWVGVFFLLLTWRSRQDASKLKRLAMLATDCSAALFAGVVMTGSSKFGGFERGAFHLADMIFFFALFLVMQSETHSSTPAAHSTPIKQGLGWNCKSLIVLLLVIMTVKIFLMSDVMGVDYVTGGSSKHVTDLARFWWDFTIIVLFEALLATAFVLYYGDFGDQEAFIITVAVMEVVSFLYTMPIWNMMRSDLWPSGIVSMVVAIVLCILAVVIGRRQQRRSGYEPVVSANV